ncbi:putative cytokinetic ring protein SteA [Corynebacterium pseudopelargi]|uniref:SteA-like C-terminal domain-containing protein n=1 Tax=Corynebacterium pseudopelargi TaxID=2080757 RepID=A0A3G6IUP0_9CORY|nr:putative cytokinetic ring protein SteA [Corynebacterium pseudopelargi]AZA09353.1 hypothetical protein CPPEL_06175 [Corynebacterium pseudopelargi]
MSAMSLFSRSEDLPGLHAVLRDCSPGSKGLKRLSAGDIAVIDAPDITRTLAQELIQAEPKAVVNVARFTTGAIPNYGPQMLLDADILLVEAVGASVWEGLRSGRKGRLTEDGELYHGDKLIAQGEVLRQLEVESQFSEAQQSLVDRMEAYFGNTIQFIHSEAPLLIDGLGVPESGAALRDRKVLVVSPGLHHREQLKELRNFIREFEPALIGVDAGADTLVEMGYEPDFIVGDPAGIGAEALRSGARVVLPADPDGHAVGLERIQDLGIGATTFPAAVDSATDLALLLAEFHGAELIVNVGAPFDLEAVFAERKDATPSAMLTRLKVNRKLIDASNIIDLYTLRSGSGLGWMWAILGLLIAAAVFVIIAGSYGDGSFMENFVDTWNNIALWFQGLFS